MLNTNNQQQSMEPVSGSVEIITDNGRVMSVFALSAKDFERIKPDEGVYREVAAMMAADKNHVAYAHIKEPLTNEQRLLGLIQG